ncbi:hypothetical protein TKK_0019108 [Trichogramma kaykai]
MKSISSHAYTRLTTTKRNFKWIINEYSTKIGGPGEFIESPKFKVVEGKEELYLRLYPLGLGTSDTSKPYSYADLMVYTTSLGVHDYRILPLEWRNCKVSILVYDRPVAIATSRNCSDSPVLIPQLFQISDSKDVTSEKDDLTIRCEITVDSQEIHSKPDYVSLCRLDMSQLFLNRSLCDVTLCAADKETLQAHKIVLAAASPVFDEKFKENRDCNSIDMSKYEELVIYEMLRYVYLGTIMVESKEEFILHQLLLIANEYGIQGLKNKCEQELLAKLTTRNALSIFRSAYLSSADRLKDEVIKYIKSHYMAISETDEIRKILNPVRYESLKSMLSSVNSDNGHRNQLTE